MESQSGLHLGRAEQMLTKIDGSVLDETNAPKVDLALDMFDPAIGPPYAADWLARQREAQSRRLRRITDRVEKRLAEFARSRSIEVADEAFVIHRTQADPRNLDLAIDSNDRTAATLGGDARNYNIAANGLARLCTLRSFLSQWSPWRTRAHGPTCLARLTAPKLIIDHTGDQTGLPESGRRVAGGGRSSRAISRSAWRHALPAWPAGAGGPPRQDAGPLGERAVSFVPPAIIADRQSGQG